MATVAAAAEESGWDGLLVWDHVHYRGYSGRPFGDPWMLLTAAVLATSRIRVGTLLTPVARYRPQQLARQVATLDNLSGGRVVFAAGLGGPVEDEYGSFGDSTDRRVLAERLDEGLELLGRFWTGEAVDHHGRHYQARNVSLQPATVQRPRPPVWIGGFWPNRPPMRRAARWDGAVPLFKNALHGYPPDPEDVRELITYVRGHREGDAQRPFDLVVGGATPTDAAKGQECDRPAARRGCHLVGRTATRSRPRCGLPGSGAAAHRGWAAGTRLVNQRRGPSGPGEDGRLWDVTAAPRRSSRSCEQ